MIRDSSPSFPHESAEFSWFVPPTTADYHLWAEYGQLSQTHSGFCIIFRTTDWRGGPDHTQPHIAVKGALWRKNLDASMNPGWLTCAKFANYRVVLNWGLVCRFKTQLIICSICLSYLTNSFLSGARTDACQTVDQILTPYMNISTLTLLTLIKLLSLFCRLYTCGWCFTCSSVVIHNSPWCNKYFCLRHLKSPGISLLQFMWRFP